MKKIYKIIIAAIFVVGMAVFEIIIANKYLNETEAESKALLEEITEENYTWPEMKEKVSTFKSKWEEKENLFCYLVNHKDIEDLGEVVTVLETAQQEEDYSKFVEYLNLTLFYAQSYKHVFGINIRNII